MPPVAAAILTTLVDLALPPRCPGCGIVTREPHRFCAGCWSSLRFIGPPWCAACNTPFAYDRGEGALCGLCLERQPRHAGVRAAVVYGDVARSVALRLKYAGRTGLAETMAGPMSRLLPADADLLVPVPLHRTRLWTRGFNQAALIAAAVARTSGVPNDPLLLRRRRRTAVLRGLGATERARTVAGAFNLVPSATTALRDRHVVLVDDVYTSGATADACARVLLRGGAARVTVLCWARVLDARDD
jgi:ComF family protein